MPKTLLLADDSVVIQKLVALSFANEDVELITVYNGDEALQKVREKVPDLVLADVVMPGKNGYEVCHAIKQDPGLSHIPVLLLTGTFESFDETRAQQVGSDGKITKPFEAQALVERVNELLAGNTPNAAAPVQPSAAPAAAPPVAPVSGGGSDAFDFFDDDLGGTSVGNGALDDASLEVDGPFEPGGDSTIAIHPTSAPSSNPIDAPAPPAQPAPRTIGGAEPAAPPASADAGATMVVGSDFAAPPVAAPQTPPASADPGATMVVGSDFAAPPGAAPQAPPASSDPGATIVADDLFVQPIPAPQGSPVTPPAPASPAASSTPIAGPGSNFDVSSSDLGDPFAAEPTPETPHQALAPDLAGDPGVQATAGGVPAGLSAVMRDRIHETLEKVAWEAFADLSETIVQQVLQRVEQVAWETIPQMAEVLVQEEIRRMKGENES